MKTAIVTGVAGFIGSSLAERLLKNKIRVIGIDSFTKYYPKKIKQNVSIIITKFNFFFIATF